MEEIKSQNTGNLTWLVGINITLGLALVVLYVLFFNSGDFNPGKDPIQPTNLELPDLQNAHAVSIAFVNTDVLLERYELVKKLAAEFDQEQHKRESDLQARTKTYEEEAAYFQESIRNNSLSEQSAQKIYEQLMIKQQELYELQQKYTSEMAQREFEMNKTLLDSVKNYLDRMNIDAKYDYILNYSVAGGILHAKDTFDITEYVLTGLNREYNGIYGSRK